MLDIRQHWTVAAQYPSERGRFERTGRFGAGERTIQTQ